MAYFECIVGNGGGGQTDIPLIVNCDAQFAGLTITATQGLLSYTETCPSTSPYQVVFHLPQDGTWTVSATISGTVFSDSVVISAFEANLTVSATVTLYSAASDTIYYYPDNDTTQSPVTLCTTDANGAASDVVIHDGIVYYSSVGKNPSDLSSDYSKILYTGPTQTTAYLMPDTCLYWFGFQNNLQTCSTANGWTATGGRSFADPVYNTNSISLGGTSGKDSGVGSVNKVNAQIVKCIIKGVSGTSPYGRVGFAATKDGPTIQIEVTATSMTYYEKDAGSIDDYYLCDYAINSRKNELYALWYE